MTVSSKPEHTPVFLDQILTIAQQLNQPLSRVRTMFDGTFGRGGHTRALLNLFTEATLLARDWDADAIQAAEISFANELQSGRLKLERASFSEPFRDQQSETFDLMLLDLGVSSPQLDRAERGFSFYHDGPLDMRMDQRREFSACDIVNTWSEQDLARLFIEYGEVQRPYRVVRAIVNDRQAVRPFATTRDLSSLIERVDGWSKKGSHPATRYFMALRLKVNEELDGLSLALPNLMKQLKTDGQLYVISFHSLEDRIVKHAFRASLETGYAWNKKVIEPSEEEIRSNPRARSAKLRVFIKAQPPVKGNKYANRESNT